VYSSFLFFNPFAPLYYGISPPQAPRPSLIIYIERTLFLLNKIHGFLKIYKINGKYNILIISYITYRYDNKTLFIRIKRKEWEAIDKVSLFLYYKGNIQSEGLFICQKDLRSSKTRYVLI
jgi:hypothetical protein